VHGMRRLRAQLSGRCDIRIERRRLRRSDHRGKTARNRAYLRLRFFRMRRLGTRLLLAYIGARIYRNFLAKASFSRVW
jgi:hypothetical protein